MDGNAAHNRTMAVIVMGVSGSGKTTIARLLAERLGWQFQEGDDLHPPGNVAKMRGGRPLTDADRLPWLRRIARRIDEWRVQGRPGVLTCSALKRSYRDIITGGRPDVRLVYLEGSRALLRRRLGGRRGHFMPADLLDSQLATLEEPAPKENAITVDVDALPDRIVDAIVGRLKS